VAFLEAFDATSGHAGLQPAWIFTHAQSSETPRPVAETISHEVGHNLGLSHDGNENVPDEEEYYLGHGLWAPIMGFSDFAPVAQWSNGAYAGATNTENDITVIANHGAPLRTDEAGAGVAQAAPATAAIEEAAYITQRSDVDVWSLGTCTGSMSVTATPAAVAPNLDIKLTLLDGAGATLDTDDPQSGDAGDGLSATGMGASVATSASGQALYVSVDGTGRGTPSAQYDDFGSLGAYTLSVAGCSGGGDPDPDPDPVAEVPGAPTIGKATPGRRGKPFTATIAWSAPSDDGGSPLTAYVVLAHKVDADGFIVDTLSSDALSPSVTKQAFKLRKGRWAFQVIAVNAEGESDPSGYSAIVRAR
jgi:hypothetical protein